jgi:hypothetical protein
VGAGEYQIGGVHLRRGWDYMSVYTDWFLAEECEAEALAESESPFDTWPCLSMKSIIVCDMMVLWGVLRGEPDSLDDVTDKDLFSDLQEEGAEGLVVSRVLPEFIDALAALDKRTVRQFARMWHQSEQLAEWDLGIVAALLQEMAEFAQRAKREGKPVLQLSAW